MPTPETVPFLRPLEATPNSNLDGADLPATFHLLRPIRGGRSLAVRNDGGPIRLNGLPMPRLAVLFDGDRIRLADGRGFEVVLPRTVSIGAADPAMAGRSCPVCRAAVEVGESVLSCSCGTVIHCAPAPLEGSAGDEGVSTSLGTDLGADADTSADTDSSANADTNADAAAGVESLDCAGWIRSCPVCGEVWGRNAGEVRT